MSVRLSSLLQNLQLFIYSYASFSHSSPFSPSFTWDNMAVMTLMFVMNLMTVIIVTATGDGES